ncbi:hypothetical protein BGX34_007549 [Mortierella sp. NVP85]|nr:hypothetical protein BGX34_007549 [Mortierella sp. NVP85]
MSALLIPEILRIVFEALDPPSLAAAASVCRPWHLVALQVLWTAVSTAPSRPFYSLLRKYGRHTRFLHILFDAAAFQNLVPLHAQLARILLETPRLTTLAIAFASGASKGTLGGILQVIQDRTAPSLRSLTLSFKNLSESERSLYAITPELASTFFPAFVQLAKLELDMHPSDNVLAIIVESLPNLVKASFKEDPAPSFEKDSFHDDSLQRMGLQLKSLTHLTITSNLRLTSEGLAGFATNCKTLTRLNLSHCLLLGSDGLEKLVEASPLLTAVALNDTNAGDELLHKLATPARADRLQFLSIRFCAGITTIGVQSIIKRCSWLRELDFAGCAHVLINVFTDYDWACLRLRVLRFGGIHQAATPGSNEVARRVTELDQTNMYTQLGRLIQLEELDMSALPFGLKLFDLGRSAIEGMRHLNTLDLTQRRGGLMDKEVIWLAAKVPSLRTLRIDANAARHKLLVDIGEIFGQLHIEPTCGMSDESSDDVGTENDDSEVLGSSTNSSESTEDSDTPEYSANSSSEESEAVEDMDSSEDSQAYDTEESDSADDSDEHLEDSDSSNVSDMLSRRLRASRITDSGASDSSDSPTSDSSNSSESSDSSDSEMSESSGTSGDSGGSSREDYNSSMEDVDMESDDEEESDSGVRYTDSDIDSE